MQAKASSFQLSTKLRGRSKNKVASNYRDDLDPERRSCTRTMTRARLEIIVGSRAPGSAQYGCRALKVFVLKRR